MRFYTPLASLRSRLFLALATQIVGTIESQIVDSRFLHIGFEFVFAIDFALPPEVPRLSWLPLVLFPFFVGLPLDFFFLSVFSMRLPRLFVVVYLLAFYVASFSFFLSFF
jgi:hypothetical protein